MLEKSVNNKDNAKYVDAKVNESRERKVKQEDKKKVQIVKGLCDSKKIFGKFKNFFADKFDLIIIIIGRDTNIKFYLKSVNEGMIKIKKEYYFVDYKAIKKTNTKFSLIMYSEGNPNPHSLEHDEPNNINANNLKTFMKSNVLKNVLAHINDENSSGGMGFMHWLIIIGLVVIAIILILGVTGVVDVGGFFLPPK